MQFVLKALTRIPLPLLHAGGWLVYFVAFRIMGWRRARAEHDLANAFPEKNAAQRASILRRNYRNLADGMMEAFWGYGASAQALKRRVAIENPEVVTHYWKEGRSVVLLAAHYGNWEWLLLTAGAQFGFPIDAIYQPLRVASVDAFVREARSRFGGKPIPHKEFIYTLMSRASQTRAYALIADQTPRQQEPKHWTRFLNQDTAFFKGAGKIAQFLDAPVLFVTMRRVRRGYYTARLTVLAEPPYDESADTLIVERYARALEQAIREHPAEWLWVQKKWKYTKQSAAGQVRAKEKHSAAAGFSDT